MKHLENKVLFFFVHSHHHKTNDCESGIPQKSIVAEMVYHFVSLSNHSKCLSSLIKRFFNRAFIQEIKQMSLLQVHMRRVQSQLF